MNFQTKLDNLSIRLERALKNIVSPIPNNVSPNVIHTNSFSYLCTSRNMYIDLSKRKNRRDKRFIEDNSDF